MNEDARQNRRNRAGAACACRRPRRITRTGRCACIIAFPPGSATDIIGRVISAKVSELWGQQALADNRGGAGGSIASAHRGQGARRTATRCSSIPTRTSVNPSFYAKLPYDTLKDFTDIMPLVAQPNILVVTVRLEDSRRWPTYLAEAQGATRARSISPSPAWAAARTSTPRSSSSTPRSTYTLVAYKGSGEIFPDLLAGRVDSYFAPISAGAAVHPGGQAAGAGDHLRQALEPAARTCRPSRSPACRSSSSSCGSGCGGRRACPRPSVEQDPEGLRRRAGRPGRRASKLAALGNEIMMMTPAEFRKFIRERDRRDTRRSSRRRGSSPSNELREW